MYQFDRVGVAQISISIIVVYEERTGQGNEEGEQQFYTRPSFGLQDRFVKAGSCNLNSMGLTQLRSRSKAESICVERVELGPTAVGETPNRRTPLESSYRVTPRGQEREGEEWSPNGRSLHVTGAAAALALTHQGEL
jgi:hypothetical protein